MTSVGTNHGTSVAEIVHDMAPEAELYLAKVSTTVQLDVAMNDMLAAGVDIINHSVAWFGAALIRGQNPALNAVQLKDVLIATAQDVASTGYDLRTGFGRISLGADLDEVNHDSDNCSLSSNPNQADLDADGVENPVINEVKAYDIDVYPVQGVIGFLE